MKKKLEELLETTFCNFNTILNFLELDDYSNEDIFEMGNHLEIDNGHCQIHFSIADNTEKDDNKSSRKYNMNKYEIFLTFKDEKFATKMELI